VLLHLLAPTAKPFADKLGVARAVDQHGVAITFDDGPHPEGTPAVLEILAQAGISATFFLTGEQVVQRPHLAQQTRAAGHLIALHGYQHKLQLRLKPQQVADDMRRGAAAIEDATGVKLTHHRPPYGIYSPAGLETAQALNLTPLLWSTAGKDWRKFTTPARIATRATKTLKHKGVILLHDADFYSSKLSHRKTIEALPLILAELNRRELATVLPV
jgi:peptidoglycan/xylan/chitin deacetylase (PgdA/CDA1 family)